MGVASVGSYCKNVYETTLNAVSTAEKRPACKGSAILKNDHELQITYEDKKTISAAFHTLKHLLIIFVECLPDFSPPFLISRNCAFVIFRILLGFIRRRLLLCTEYELINLITRCRLNEFLAHLRFRCCRFMHRVCASLAVFSLRISIV